MKSQRIVRSGAAIGGAVALLLISALLAPSTALAERKPRPGSISLQATGLEPEASGSATWAFQYNHPFPWGGYENYMSVTVSCRGLTPGKQYHLELMYLDPDPWNWRNSWAGDGVASQNGKLQLAGGFEFQFANMFYATYVSISSADGVVLEGYIP